MDLEVETIDRRKAEEYLRHNTDNRPMSPGHVVNLVARQKRGEWVLNPADAIVFDSTGNLRNGQHRLQMVVATGESIDAVVARDASPEAFLVFDDGKARTVADVLHIKGEDDTALLGASLNWIWRYLSEELSGKAASKSQLLKILERHSDIRKSVNFCSPLFLPATKEKALIVAFHWLCSRIDAERSNEFTRRFIQGHGWAVDDGTDPVFVLREQMHGYRENPRQSPLTRHQKMVLFVSAWHQGATPRGRRYRMPHRDGKFPALKDLPESLYFEPEDETQAALSEGDDL